MSVLLIWFINILAIEITSLAVKDDRDGDTEDRYTFGMLQTCKRHDCVFKHSSRRFLHIRILCHSYTGDDWNSLCILNLMHFLTTKLRGDPCTVFGFRWKSSLMMSRVIFGARVKSSGKGCPLKNNGIVLIGCATMSLSKMKQAT